MPIYLSKTGYGYTYKKETQHKNNKKKKPGAKFFIFVIIVILIVVVIYTGVRFFRKRVVNNERYLYAINILTTNNFDEANLTSEYVKNQGAGGYVYACDNEYVVLLSCYSSEEDANKVMSNLNENGYKVSLYKIEFPSYKSNENNFTKAVDVFFDTYKELYNLSVKYDKNEIENEDFKNNLKMLISKNEQIFNDFNKYYEGSSVKGIIYTKIYLQFLNDNLNELYNKNNNLSSEIKSHYFYVIFLYKQLLQNIQ